MVALVAGQGTVLRPQRSIGVEDGGGHLFVEPGVGQRSVELAQLHLAVGPGEVEDPVGEVAITVFFYQLQTALAAVGDAADQVDGGGLARIESDAAADRDNRVEHRAGGSTQYLRAGIHGRRVNQAATSANEARAVGLVGNAIEVCSMDRHQMAEPGRLFLARTWPTRAEDRLQRLEQFGLHEEIAECTVQRIADGWRQYHLGVAGELDAAPGTGAVGQGDPPQFDVIFRGNDDFAVGVEVPVANTELRAGVGEDGFVLVRTLQRRLVRGGPELATGDIAQVAEHAPIITGGVLVPTGHGQLATAAVPAAGAADHHVVAAIGKQLHGRQTAPSVGVYPQPVFDGPGGDAAGLMVVGVLVFLCALGHALLQKQCACLELRIRLEALLHGTIQQQAGQCQQAHALVVGHERANHCGALPARQACLGEVDGFVQAVTSGQVLCSQGLQIPAGLLGGYQQGECRGVGRYHHVVAQAALEPQARHAERPVLVVEVRVQGVVAGFRDAPGKPHLLAVLNLPGDGGAAGLVEQGAFVSRHHQQRHQVLEHRAGPGQQYRYATVAGEQPAEAEPARLGQLALGDRHKGAQPRLGREQVVVARVQAALVDVVADAEQIALAVVEETEIHFRQVCRCFCQALGIADACGCMTANCTDAVAHRFRPLPGIQLGELAPGGQGREVGGRGSVVGARQQAETQLIVQVRALCA
ncbi:hypothetical protein D9M72_230590 [compost metagenome]